MQHLLAFNENVTLAELNEVEPFSQGGFCVICSCVYRGQQAVLKIPKPATASSRSGGAAQDLLREISIYRQISQRGGHPNIARAFGAGTHVQQGETSPSPFLLLERLEGGTLENAFERSTAVWSDPIGRLPVAIELAEAVAFLHEAAIPGGVVLHSRDLKPSNIGLCGAGHIKVFDLGLSVVRQVLEAPTRVYEMSGMAGSKRFMAPEVCTGLSYNEKVDVYSFALVLWQICALRKPFAGMSEADHYLQVVQGGLRPPLDARWPPQLVHLLQACWHVHPDARPTMVQARDTLRQIFAMGGGGGAPPY
ncbi:unnamed protein product [Ectocarpus sp. 12 AP-2014]